MKRINSAVFMAALFCVCLLAVGLARAGEFPKLKMVFSMPAVPEDAHTKGAQKFCDEVKRLTNGNVVIDFFHSAQLFSQDADLPACIRGDLDFVTTAPNWLEDGSPWISMLAAGYIFTSYDHMTKILNGDIGKAAYERVAKEQGVRPLNALYLGTRQINLREDKHVRTPADLKGVNLRMPNSESWLFLGKALGANPTPLAFNELYMALSTGVVDGQDNPLPSTKNAKFYEVTKSITLTNHSVNNVMITVNEKRWQSFSPELKAVMLQAAEAGRKLCDELNLKTEAEAVDFFKSKGLKVYEADIPVFREHVLKQYLDNKELTKSWDMDLYKQISDMAK